MVLVFDDGQALFLRGEQMTLFSLESKGFALPEGTNLETATREDWVGHLFQMMFGFIIGAGGVDTDADNISDALEPYLVHVTEIPPLFPLEEL